MSRLLFAAARGARIEVCFDDDEHQWFIYQDVSLNGYRLQRIHPDDAHLQYGPISTELRDYAIEAPMAVRRLQDRIPHLTWSVEVEYDEVPDELHRSLFLLILAEALADSGL